MVSAPLLVNPGFDLAGRTVMVTGASSGLGERFAFVAAANGANVVLAARRVDRLEALKRELEDSGARAIAVALDVADEASTIAAYDQAEAAFGQVDSVIANAGTNQEGLALDLAVSEFDQLFAVNVRGVFLTVREGARRMIASGSRERAHGRIVIISSITAQHVAAGLAPYSSSKAAVTQLGRVLAREWANKGINVNMICPGYVVTDINGEWFAGEGGRKQIASFPRRRIMDAGALDAMLLYLASDASAQVTGSVFTIDDGQTL